MESATSDARSLAHELNNDLGLIIAECDLLDGALKPEEADASTYVKAIRMAAGRMADRISSGPGPTVISTSKRRKQSQQPSPR